MAQVYKKLKIDVNKSNPGIVAEAVQNDANSRFLDIVLVDGSTPINLTGHEVRIYGKKYDGTEFYNNGEITEPTAGRCQFELTSQALAVANDLEVQIIVFYNNVEVLSTQSFRISVVKSLMSDSAIESSNEYGALIVLYQNLYEAYDLMVEMVQKIGVPGEQAESLNLDTMFEVWDWMVEYLQANSTAGIVETVNTILSRIGVQGDTGSTTVMGKLNKVDAVYIPSDVEREALLSTPMTQGDNNTFTTMAKFTPKRNGVVRIKVTATAGSTAPNIIFSVFAYGQGSTSFPFLYYVEQIGYPVGTVISGIAANSYYTTTFSTGTNGGSGTFAVDLPVMAGWVLVIGSIGLIVATQRATYNSIKVCYDEVTE